MLSTNPVIIAAIDLITVLACLIAMGFVLRGRKRPGLAPEITLLFLLLAGLMALYGGGLFLEWSGLIPKINWHFLEDLGGIFIPFAWAFAFYVVDKSAVLKDLQISRTRFRNLVESTSDWIWEVDTHGRYTYVSPRVRRILGYTPDELLGKTPFDLMPPDEAARISKIFAGFLENNSSFQYLENLNLHKDGTEVYLETNGTPIFDDNGKLTGYRGVDRDITIRKKAELEIARHQAEMDSIFAASPAGIALVRNRKLVHVNARFSEITGYGEDELLAIDLQTLYLSPVDYEEIGRKYQHALEEGTAAIETRWVRADETIIDVMLYLSPMDGDEPNKGFVVIVQDISELKAARQEATEEKTRSQTYLDVVNVMIVVMDDARRVKLINKRGCEILERSADEVQGADWLSFLPPSYQQITRGVLDRLIAGDVKSVEYFENPVCTPSGVEKLIAWHNAVLRDESGNISGVISSGEDITRARAAEQAARESDQRLRMALSAAKMGSWRWQVDTDEDVRDANLNAILGLPAEETVQSKKDFFQYVYPEDCEAAQSECEHAITERRACHIQFRIIRKDGQVRWVLDQGKPFYDANGQLDYMTGVLVDVTEQVEYQQRYQNVIDSAPMGILTYELDADDHLILTGSNGAAAAILKADFSALIGKPIEKIFPELVNTPLPDEYRRICREGGHYHGDNFEYRDERVGGFYEFDAFQTSPGKMAVMFLDVTERKQAEKALQESEEKYRTIFHSGNQGFFLMSDIFLDCNDRVCEIWNCSREEVIGHSPVEFSPEYQPDGRTSAEAAKAYIDAALAGRPQRFYWQHQRKDGTLVDTEITLDLVKLNDQALLQATMSDITERRKAQSALREAEHRKELALQGGNLATWDWDLVTGKVIYDERWATMLGYTPDQLQPDYTTWERLVHPDDLAETLRVLNLHLEGKTDSYEAETRLKHKSGRWIWILTKGQVIERDADGKALRICGTHMDITNRKSAEQALQFTQFAVDHAGDAAYWMGSDGKLIYVNDLSCQTLGYTREELLSMAVYDLDPDFSVEVLPKHWEQLRKQGTLRFESHHKTKDGHVFPVEITANFVEYDGEEYNCAFARDIRERKAAEQEREVLMQQLRDRNDELQSIVFTTAHDLRSPLVNIEGFTGELEKDLQKLEETLAGQKLNKQAAKDIEYLIKTNIAESLGFVRSGSQHMDMLLNGLMRLSVVGSAPIQLSEVDMKNLFDTIIEALQFRINENVIDISVQDELPNCFGDFAMLTQVFSNLIDNAIKYCHPERKAVVEIGASIQDDMIEYTVADNGIGIESPHLEKVFELFHRLHPRHQQDGQGLGLTIVRRILDRLGGTARIESVPDKGTTVRVRLPRA